MVGALILGIICFLLEKFVVTGTEWPKGTYGIPEPKTGCPNGFVHGSRTRMVKGYSASESLNLAEYYNRTQNTITMKFCMKITNGNGPEWPRGTYCIYKKGHCPINFSDGHLRWDDAAPYLNFLAKSYQDTSGILPDGEYNHNTVIEFCCQKESVTAMKFSFSKPFFLLRFQSHCPVIKGANVEVQSTTSQDESQLFNGNTKTNSHQSIDHLGGERFRLSYCYYTEKEIRVGTLLVVIYVIGSIVAASVLISCIMFMVRFFYQNRRMNTELSGESAQERMFRSSASEEEKLEDLEEKDEPPTYEEVIKDENKYKVPPNIRNPYREEI